MWAQLSKEVKRGCGKVTPLFPEREYYETQPFFYMVLGVLYDPFLSIETKLRSAEEQEHSGGAAILWQRVRGSIVSDVPTMNLKTRFTETNSGHS